MEEEKNPLEKLPSTSGVDELIKTKTNNTNNVKEAIDLLATKTALEKEGVVEKIVEEKAEELRIDAETKRVLSEIEKIKQEKEKELVELDKTITTKKKEVEDLNAESDKEQAYFESNKDILRCIGVRRKKSIGAMKVLMYPATFIFIVVQILLFPLTFLGIVFETIVNIIGGLCGVIQNNALRIIVAVLVVALLLGGGFCAYYYGGKLLTL